MDINDGAGLPSLHGLQCIYYYLNIIFIDFGHVRVTYSSIEAAPASIEGRGAKGGRGLRYLRYARNRLTLEPGLLRALEAKSCSVCCSLFGL